MTVEERPHGRFQFLAGRRHVADAPYVLPKDEKEIQRLDFQHFMLRFLMRGNYVAPIRQPTSILDVGCGTGRWVMEMANLFPQANVVGVDLVPPPSEQIRHSAATGASQIGAHPENYAFVQGNILEGLPFASGQFDFVHMRLLVFGLPADRWQDVANELARVTRPGGWVEWLEGNIFTQHPGPAHQALNQLANAAAQRRGVDATLVERIGDYLRGAGLVNVTARDLVLPAGSRAGRLGQMAVSDYLAVMGGMKGPLAAMGIIRPEEFDRLTAAARQEFEQVNAYWRFPLAYGQRPA
jgi:ubiquinone/menaquinone biosynthesis C-methylase UbiE